jgi:hypothetical protein
MRSILLTFSYCQRSEEEGIHHETAVEHGGPKKLIVQIENSSPGDDCDATVKVLAEMAGSAPAFPAAVK